MDSQFQNSGKEGIPIMPVNFSLNGPCKFYEGFFWIWLYSFKGKLVTWSGICFKDTCILIEIQHFKQY
jgi:hypothetical protein